MMDLPCFSKNKTYWEFDVSFAEQNKEPQLPGSSSSRWSPAWSHVLVVWHPIPQTGCVAADMVVLVPAARTARLC